MLEICRMLVKRGADVNLRNEEGKTALMEFAFNGNRRLCQLMLECGTEIDLQDYEFGKTALFWATDLVSLQETLQSHTLDEWQQYVHDKRAVCEMLLEKGASVEVRDKDGNEVMQYAQDTELAGCFEKLRQHDDQGKKTRPEEGRRQNGYQAAAKE